MTARLTSLLHISLVLICIGSTSAYAANVYVRPSSSGNGSGSDWSNASAWSSVSLARGNTYYLSGGSYGGKTFNTPVNGTSLITIKGATAADHGTATGWQASYSVESTQATFTSSLTFGTSYWVLDGSVGSMSKTPGHYGFTFSTMNKPIYIYNTGSAITSFVISHIAATAPGSDVEKFFISTNNSTKSVSNVTISHNYLNGWQALYWATSPGQFMDNWVAEYNILLNGFSSSTNHGEWINNNYGHHRYQITRYNLFEGYSGSACMTGMIVANNNDNDYAKVYGNVFNNINACNGTVTGTSAGNLNYAEVYNNTFANSRTGVATLAGPEVAMLPTTIFCSTISTMMAS